MEVDLASPQPDESSSREICPNYRLAADCGKFFPK
jgi:hypothetical protein